MKQAYRLVWGALPLLLAGCAVGPDYRAPALPAPAQFHAALPAAAPAAPALADWWRQFDDPLVPALVQAALADNPGLDKARARLDFAQAQLAGARGALWPELQANLQAERSGLRGSGPSRVGTSVMRSLDARWQIDLFGGQRRTVEAASARAAARDADWHAARVALVAEVATQAVNYRACSAAAAVLQADTRSREQTAGLTGLKIKAGFAATASQQLIDASVADARQQVVALRADCELVVKALVALSGMPEPALRTRLDAAAALPRPAAIAVEAVPARVLAQRPDVAAAERELAAAAAAIGAAEAARYPSISLSGSIGTIRLAGASRATDSWSLLPVISLPLFDAGQRRAEVRAAEAAYRGAWAGYRDTVRAAVQETEQALVRLDAAGRREADAARAARDYDGYFKASEERFRAGPASLFELEDARRTALAAQHALIAVQQERVLAWIALYKALGGGWRAAPDAAASLAAHNQDERTTQ